MVKKEIETQGSSLLAAICVEKHNKDRTLISKIIQTNLHLQSKNYRVYFSTYRTLKKEKRKTLLMLRRQMTSTLNNIAPKGRDVTVC
jgi:hypothetical protein